jgi:hypothetical protein
MTYEILKCLLLRKSCYRKTVVAAVVFVDVIINLISILIRYKITTPAKRQGF